MPTTHRARVGEVYHRLLQGVWPSTADVELLDVLGAGGGARKQDDRVFAFRRAAI